MTKYAFLVGINYVGTSNELGGCISDINSIVNVLKGKGYLAQNINILTDNTFKKPTLANIQGGLLGLITKRAPGDTLFFYYSGHGSSTPDIVIKKKIDQVLVPIDYTTAGVITDTWLFSNICSKIIDNVTFYAFTDCCHSGTMLDLKYSVQSKCTRVKNDSKSSVCVLSEWTDKYVTSIGDQSETHDLKGDIIFYSGCLDNETSSDTSFNNIPHGAFTECLLEVLACTSNLSTLKLLTCIEATLQLHGFNGQHTELSVGKSSTFDKLVLF